MAYRNFDEYLIRLEQANLVKHIDSSAVMAAYNASKYRLDDSTQVTWYATADIAPFSIVRNLFSTEQQIAWALGVDTLRELENKLGRLLDIDLSNGPATLMARASEFMGMLRSAGLFGKKTIAMPPYKPLSTEAQVLFCDQLGADGALDGLTGQLIYKMPDTTQQKTTLAHITRMTDQCIEIGMHGIGPGQGEIPVAIVLGGDPATVWAAHMPMPTKIDPVWMAGWLRRKQVPMTAAVTLEIAVPADAELIIEGMINTDQSCVKSQPTRVDRDIGMHYPLHITAMMGTQNPIMPITTPRSYWMRKAEERLFLPIARTFLQDLHDVNFTHFQRKGTVAIASLNNSRRAVSLMHGLWGTEQLDGADAIITVDTTVDVHNLRAVASAMMDNINWHTDVIVCRVGVNKSAAYGIDATQSPMTTQPKPMTHADIFRPHIIWNDHLLITPLNDGEDAQSIIHALWAEKPAYHLLITPAQADLGNIEGVFYDMLQQVNWQTDLTLSDGRQQCIAIDASQSFKNSEA